MGLYKNIALLGFLSLAACSSSATVNTAPAPVDTTPSGTSATPPEVPTLASLVTGPGDYDLTFTWDGLERPYILHVPPAYDGSTSLPLVFILHGGGGSGESMVKLTGMNDVADHEGFLVVYPNGTVPTNDPEEPREWNSGLIPANVLPDDVGYLRSLAETIEEELHADSSGIYVAGFSYGAMMSHRLAAERPDVFAAAAMVEGTIGLTDLDGNSGAIPTPAGVIPVFMIHGKDDATIPYDGGIGMKGAEVKSVADAVAFWNAADGCTGSPLEHASPDLNIVVDDYKECAPASEVILVTIANGQHQWPTPQDQTHFPASTAIWKFFSLHSQP